MPDRDKGSGGEFASRVLWFSWRNPKPALGLEAAGKPCLSARRGRLSPPGWSAENTKLEGQLAHPTIGAEE